MMTLSQLAGTMMRMSLIEEAEHKGLEKAAVIIETEAKRVIGTYTLGWPALAPATIARKANGDTPLLETGEMRDSIQHQVGHEKASIGSNNEKAVWQELGTAKIPARSFLMGAAVVKMPEAVKAIGDAVYEHLIAH